MKIIQIIFLEYTKEVKKMDIELKNLVLKFLWKISFIR